MLRVDVRTKQDPTGQQLLDFIKEEKRRATYAYVLVFIFAHGKPGDIIVCSDNQDLHLDRIRECFSDDQEPCLLSVNSCRGDALPVVLKTDGDTDASRSSASRSQNSHPTATLYSACEGCTSFRSVVDGSPFNAAFCEELEYLINEYEEVSLKKLLHRVERSMATRRLGAMADGRLELVQLPEFDSGTLEMDVIFDKA